MKAPSLYSGDHGGGKENDGMKCEACNDRWFVYDENAGRYRCIDVAFCPMCGKPLTAAKPLTLDELRERDGRPVWIEQDNRGRWEIMSGITNEPLEIFWFYIKSRGLYADAYGKTWTAYDHPPETSAE